MGPFEHRPHLCLVKTNSDWDITAKTFHPIAKIKVPLKLKPERVHLFSMYDSEKKGKRMSCKIHAEYAEAWAVATRDRFPECHVEPLAVREIGTLSKASQYQTLFEPRHGTSPVMAFVMTTLASCWKCGPQRGRAGARRRAEARLHSGRPSSLAGFFPRPVESMEAPGLPWRA